MGSWVFIFLFLLQLLVFSLMSEFPAFENDHPSAQMPGSPAVFQVWYHWGRDQRLTQPWRLLGRPAMLAR
jgi:hypothetical protein